jgi:hypothetical protein
MAMDKFNDGVLTSESIDRQFTPEYVLEGVVEMPKRKKFFSVRADYVSMPKHHGDTITKEVRFRGLDSRNIVNANVDANYATLVKGVWYRRDAAGNVVAKYDALDYLHENAGDFQAASDAAKAAAENDLQAGEKLGHSNGGLVNGLASYAQMTGPIAPLPEEGGMVNGIMGTSKLVSARVTHHGLYTSYTAWQLRVQMKN